MRIKELEMLYNENGFNLFKNGIYNLNLFGVRATNTTPNSFDDILCIACNTEAGWYTCAVPGTTDPGASVLGEDKMGNAKGTAILPASTLRGSSQYKFVVGKHKNKYAALNQAKPFKLVRDFNKDGKLLSREDIQDLLDRGNTDEGWFGINIHHASSSGVSKRIDNWSWGCQVVQSIFDWEKMSSLVARSVEIYGSKMTYTLFDEVDIQKSLDMDINEFYLALNDNRYI
jgi:hypothetical protein